MSRMFEALHRSESERTGGTKPFSTATELLESAEQASQDAAQLRVSSLTVSVAPDKRLITLTDRDGLGAEKFRLAAVRLRYLQQAQSLKTLLITSTMAEEGKSFVAANLAITLARKQRQKVVLIDGDLRRPTLARLFGLGQLPGLSDCLATPPQGPTVYVLQDASISLLPAGSPPENPLELMHSRTLSQLLKCIGTAFDWIVIDSPPVLPLADTTMWLPLVDGVLLVTREAKSERRQLIKGLEALGRANMVGIVLNNCTTADHTYYYKRYHPHGIPSQIVPRQARSEDLKS